jgi:hypothetical protein
MQPIDYNQLIIELNKLNGVEENQLFYLNNLHTTLMTYLVPLTTYVGRMKARIMILETAKGRLELGLSSQQVEAEFGRYYEATGYLELINKISIITQQKVKIINEKI